MTSRPKSEYDNFLDVYREAHPGVDAQKRRLDANEEWKKAKKEDRIPEVLDEMKLKIRKRKSTQDSFWTKKPAKENKDTPSTQVPQSVASTSTESVDKPEDESHTSTVSADKPEDESQPKELALKPTPAQKKCSERIGEIQTQLNRLYLLRDSNMSTPEERQKIKAEETTRETRSLDDQAKRSLRGASSSTREV